MSAKTLSAKNPGLLTVRTSESTSIEAKYDVKLDNSKNSINSLKTNGVAVLRNLVDSKAVSAAIKDIEKELKKDGNLSLLSRVDIQNRDKIKRIVEAPELVKFFDDNKDKLFAQTLKEYKEAVLSSSTSSSDKKNNSSTTRTAKTRSENHLYIETTRYKWLRAVRKSLYTGLHIDATYLGDAYEYYTVWIPFTENKASKESGALVWVPGSHKVGGDVEKLRKKPIKSKSSSTNIFPNTKKSDEKSKSTTASSSSSSNSSSTANFNGASDGWVVNDASDFVLKKPYFWQTTDFNPGDVVVFGPNFLHMTVPNFSEKIRIGCDTRWRINDNAMNTAEEGILDKIRERGIKRLADENHPGARIGWTGVGFDDGKKSANVKNGNVSTTTPETKSKKRKRTPDDDIRVEGPANGKKFRTKR